jgi:hypothetical protein
MMRYSWMSLLGFTLAFTTSTLADEPTKPQLKSQPRANRLAKETSPYLLLHAHNPVDWFPWGPEAFAKAKTEGKPIFLSVGYSSCYWCHVMERESFSDAAIAKILNEKFVCIKVDREERPDVDAIYMTAVQAFSGSGGWPMSLFLMTDGRPFFGGTYFPPHEKDGASGFDTLLNAVATAWRDKRELLDRDATALTEVVKRTSDRTSLVGRVALSHDLALNGIKELDDQYDPEFAGFGFNAAKPNKPKFPEPSNLMFLLDQDRRQGAGLAPSEPLSQVLKTLELMARGGIRDHLAGGYHRYSTKRDWSVPHFEKMLYDNAQLATTHLMALERTKDRLWSDEAVATFAFVKQSLTSPEGGFYSALDAEVAGEEGQSYVWSRDEVNKILGPTDAPLFRIVYGLDREPNFEHGRFVLLEPKTRKSLAAELRVTTEELEAKLAPMRAKVLAVREKRPSLLRDDKILSSWNGLMIAAYADGYRILKDESYRAAAEKAADFLLSKMRTAEGRLLRTYRNGQAKLPAYLEDYACLAHGLLRLHKATGDATRLSQAKALTDRMIADFNDPKLGGFYYTAGDHESLLARSKDPFDNAVPSGNSVAIRVLVALGVATGDRQYLDLAEKALNAFSGSLARTPAGSPLMLLGLDEYLDARGASSKAVASKPAARANGVVTGSAPEADLKPGETIEVPIKIKVHSGYHIYANPPSNDDVIATTVSLVKADGLKLVAVGYPEGVEKVLASSGAEKVKLYEGEAIIYVRIAIDARAIGAKEAVIKVRYQACDDKACLAPATLEVAIPFKK